MRPIRFRSKTLTLVEYLQLLAAEVITKEELRSILLETEGN